MPELTPGMRAITQPGTYWLNQDVAYMDGGYGVQIETSNVILNLNGHYLGSNGPVAIYAGGQHDVMVENGHVWGGSAYGVRFDGNAGNNRVSVMDVYGQTVVGISVGGNTIVDNNSVHDMHAVDRAYALIGGGDSDKFAYNTVFGLHGGNEAVEYSDTGSNHQIYGNTFDLGGSDHFVYADWVYGVNDQITGNTFQGDNLSTEFGIYQGSPGITTDNTVYDMTQDNFYMGQFNPVLDHDHFFIV